MGRALAVTVGCYFARVNFLLLKVAMSAVKVSVSLDSEDLAWLRSRAEKKKQSLSAAGATR